MASNCDTDEEPRREMPNAQAAFEPGLSLQSEYLVSAGTMYYGHHIPPPAPPAQQSLPALPSLKAPLSLSSQLHRGPATGFVDTVVSQSPSYPSAPAAGYQYQERGREVGVDYGSAGRYELHWSSVRVELDIVVLLSISQHT